MFKSIVSLVISSSLVLVSSVAQADDFTIKVEPGVAVPLTPPQSERFFSGADLKVQTLFVLKPWLAVGPSVSGLVLPSDREGIPAGTAIGLGGGARFTRPRNVVTDGDVWTSVFPWADFDVQYVRTGELDRPGFAAAVGFSLPTTESRSVWVGPFVRYQGVFQEDHGPHWDTRSAKILVMGVSLELGSSVWASTPNPDSDNDGTPDSQDRCPYVPGPKSNFGCPEQPKPAKPQPPPVEEVKPVPPPVPEVKFEIRQKVQFLWDSYKIEDDQLTGLDEVVGALLNHVDCDVRVEGHASSEGQVEHNEVLSERRAEAVVDYLVNHGVSRSRLTAIGFGSSVPVADNATQAGREANRRVEFVINFVFVKGDSQ